ncbi:MAG: hypothetical protein A3J27_11030 [Candidatus Tectomicrobia bacterium RIFCSPLOWO2_12_FULL_69_37]|nr:MAG: hypothetical protein A3J27_11030 [Candidatus Tectomicrobia bacterium RIFCSPLOWO2_12_FULL_69_37]
MTRHRAVKWFLPAVLAALLLPAAGALVELAEAQSRRLRHGETVIVLPPGNRTFAHRGITYYYHGGTYYRRAPRGWVVVAAPFGAVVPVIPTGYRTVIAGGATYYVDDGVYYRRVIVQNQPQYEVVQAPAPAPAAPVPQQAQGASYCREAQIVISVGGKDETAFTTACREPDGSWRLKP